MATPQSRLSGTFVLNKNEAIHRWYPYIEGFSSTFVDNEITMIGNSIEGIYDPFGGCGTTPLTAAQRGIKPYYSETNPFMDFVCETKINTVMDSFQELELVRNEIKTLIDRIYVIDEIAEDFDIDYQGFEKYYKPEVLFRVLKIVNEINSVCKNNASRKLSMLALSCILVNVSNMVRRGDLRYATKNEKSPLDFDIKSIFINKLKSVIGDVENYGAGIKVKVEKLSDDAKNIEANNLVDCVITSPPYLNGTNYIRNTKLELKLLGFINNEKDLPKYHSKGIISGINSVSRRNSTNITVIDEVKPYINELEPVAYDSRIPVMVAGYFSDMSQVFLKLRNILRSEGHFIMDIGDSQFAGVHIPTHAILNNIANSYGFRLYDETILRSRRSKNGMILTQRILRYKLNK